MQLPSQTGRLFPTARSDFARTLTQPDQNRVLRLKCSNVGPAFQHGNHFFILPQALMPKCACARRTQSLQPESWAPWSAPAEAPPGRRRRGFAQPGRSHVAWNSRLARVRNPHRVALNGNALCFRFRFLGKRNREDPVRKRGFDFGGIDGIRQNDGALEISVVALVTPTFLPARHRTSRAADPKLAVFDDELDLL